MVSTILLKHKRSVSLHRAHWNSPTAHNNPISSTVNRYIPVQTSYHPYKVVYSVSRYLFEVIKCWEDDLMAPSHQTHSSQKLQDQCFCPAPKKTMTSMNITAPPRGKKKKVKAGSTEWIGLHYVSYIRLNLIHLACLTSVLQGEKLCFVSIAWEFSNSWAELLFVASALFFRSYLTSHGGTKDIFVGENMY